MQPADKHVSQACRRCSGQLAGDTRGTSWPASYFSSTMSAVQLCGVLPILPPLPPPCACFGCSTARPLQRAITEDQAARSGGLSRGGLSLCRRRWYSGRRLVPCRATWALPRQPTLAAAVEAAARKAVRGSAAGVGPRRRRRRRRRRRCSIDLGLEPGAFCALMSTMPATRAPRTRPLHYPRWEPVRAPIM